MNGQEYSLRKRLSRTSPLVLEARQQFLGDMAPETLCSDTNNVIQLLSLAQARAHAAENEEMETKLCKISQAVGKALKHTKDTISECSQSATLVVQGQSQAYDALVEKEGVEVGDKLLQADVARKKLCKKACAATKCLSKLVRKLGDVITSVHEAHNMECGQAQHAMDGLVRVREKRSSAVVLHARLMESHMLTARHLGCIERAERMAARRAYFAVAFRCAVHSANRLLQSKLGVHALNGMAQGVEDALHQARRVQRQRGQVFSHKLSLRYRGRRVLKDVSECMRTINQGEKVMESHRAKAAMLCECAVLLKKVSEIIIRIVSFLTKVHTALQQLCCKQLIGAVGQTCAKKGDMDITSSQVPRCPDDELSRLWIASYAKWAAFGDICEECDTYTCTYISRG